VRSKDYYMYVPLVLPKFYSYSKGSPNSFSNRFSFFFVSSSANNCPFAFQSSKSSINAFASSPPPGTFTLCVPKIVIKLARSSPTSFSNHFLSAFARRLASSSSVCGKSSHSASSFFDDEGEDAKAFDRILWMLPGAVEEKTHSSRRLRWCVRGDDVVHARVRRPQ